MASPRSRSRIACLLVPDLPLQARLRAEPDLVGRPLAIASGPGSRAEIVAASAEAEARGVRRLTSVVQARAMASDLEVRVSSPAIEQAARAALLDVGLSFAPRADLAAPGPGVRAAEAAVHVDASGMGRLFPGEAAFASALAARAEGLGLRGVVSVAASRSLAHLTARELACASREGAGIRVVAPGEEQRTLAAWPIELLDPDDALADSLTRFGIRRVGDLLQIPARSLAARLGPTVRPLIALARGEERSPPLPERHDERRLEESFDLEHPIDRLEPLQFVARGMLARLCERLGLRGLAAGDLDLVLHLEGGARDARRSGVAAPTHEVRVLLRLCMLALEAGPPRAPIEAVSLATEGQPARSDQLDLFRPPGPAPAELHRTLAELEALCGPDRVGAPAALDEHRPGGFGLRPFSPSNPPAPDASVTTGSHAAPRLALRALRPPLPARVETRDGVPTHVTSRVARGRVTDVAGPWRISGAWWAPEEHFSYDQYDVEIEGHGEGGGPRLLARLRFDRTRRSWHLDALYD